MMSRPIANPIAKPLARPSTKGLGAKSLIKPMASGSGTGPPTSVAPNIQEFNIRVPKSNRRKNHVMRFNATLNVDFAQWKTVKMERENNMKEFRGMEEEMPKFGAGSEYNRDLREEARRKKFGIIAKRYRPEAQPWILKVGGKPGKKFKGIREGGVGENAAFYVFTHAPDGHIEAYPLYEWYNFQPIQRYKSLSAEEAEHEFGRRKKVVNYFSLMLRKRLRGDEEDDHPEPDDTKIKSGPKKDLKISDMDEWIDSDEDSDSDDDEKEKKESDSDNDKKKKKGKAGKPDKKKKRDLDGEAFEESDDGDEEGREMDYDTESSEDEPDPEAKVNKELKSVAEEDALRKLLTSDEEDEDDEKKSGDESDKEDEKKKMKEKEESAKDKKKKKTNKNDKKDSSSDFSSDSSNSGFDSKKKKRNNNSRGPSRSGTPTVASNENKRKIVHSMPTDLTGSENSNSPVTTPAKKVKTETAPSLPVTFTGVVNSSSKDDYGITEEAVRRYLMRKPMTATELLTKFKNKKTGVSSERLVETMTQILKRINPVKQTIQGKMYLSIKVNK